ncbi:MAG: dephospho-CoA kinase [Bacteroidales bacterium]|nr:dephospho-CoA kinase [Bacteroidales bacterium]
MSTRRIGITGGMGCGKSTVVEAFRGLGVPAFVADRAGAECYADPAFLHQLRNLFGNAVFTPDGQADKRAVARIVFADNASLQALNALVHPRVRDAFDRFCALHADAPYVLFESAILYDHGFDRQMDAVIGVYLSLEERLSRLMLRDGADEQSLMARIRSQLPAAEILRRADYVILNYEGNPRQRQVEYIDKCLKK